MLDDKCYGEKMIKENYECEGVRQPGEISRVIHMGLNEKITFNQRLKGGGS